ncbi:nuclear transport factor 2 family protein [Solimonas sp. K1W22B-7]|uniref:nuclear transport factor 2 family protein n=1 Tax=Solimonas sp. K1W22B-7 TaxID=2303331 RepID=UPI000E334C0C|nr:nuclear transport factor 2 family protein [Solimonas sp. K1W22B-7]AXQ29233.1 nuclear transport factor 2 family protein [Solimonas sp. K1W22B-7]
MPSTETLERFIARVEDNAHPEAIEEFYAPHATMRENQSAPRVGRGTLVSNERGVMARAQSVRSQCVRPVLASGEHVAIRWIFDFHWRDGSHSHIEEVTWQRWEGEQIAEETFFYDPAQMRPVKRPA